MFEIIAYTPAYEEQVMALIRNEGEDWSIYWEEPNATKYRRALQTSPTYLALKDGTVCGYCRVIEDVLSVYIGDLLVDASCRGNALGRKLMERVQQDYPTLPVYIMSGNDGYYKSLGYSKEGSIYMVNNGVECQEE